MNLLYDGSFEGLLTCVFKGFELKEQDLQIWDELSYVPSFLDQFERIGTDSDKSARVVKGIVEKLGEESFNMVIKVYLSECDEAGTLILNYLKLAFKKGPSVLGNLAHESVGPFVKTASKVSRELHKMVGLIRFSELNSGIYYSVYESDHSLLLLLAPHFKERLGDQVWVLHDIKRSAAAFYDKQSWYIRPLTSMSELKYSEREEDLQQLWQRYHKEMAIAARLNPKLQRQMMPKKYWKYLTEMVEIPRRG